MRTIYHEFESLEHLLATRLLPGGGDRPVRFVVFGGTGAVGGATVLELCRLILMSPRYRQRPLRGEVYATGLHDKEIVGFVKRLYMAFEGEAEIEKIEPRRHYRLRGAIDLRFSHLHLTLPQDLHQHVLAAREAGGGAFDPEAALAEYFESQPKPFLRFVEALGEEELLHAVVVAIPLPSVATYTLESIDRLNAELGLDHKTLKHVKSSYLKTFIRGLATIQQRYARHVVMAHTTAVGGMYRVDGGAAEIRLGFAHSALGKRLVDKKYFADELTQLYIDHGFYVLVTAAAIGIDAVELHCHLPLDRGVRNALRRAVDARPESPPLPAADLEQGNVLVYPALDLALEPTAERSGGETTGESEPLVFGAGKELAVDAAIRSGENGLFSVANCDALYNVMKVAIPEELAMVLVRFALFGPERRRDWFQDNLCYYTETENAHFALQLLYSYPELRRACFGPFAIQAYQALGSSTHQARLHELGLVMVLLRLRDLGARFAEIPEKELAEGLTDVDGFLWLHTSIPAFEDFEALDAARLEALFGALCEVETMEDAGLLLGYDPRRHGLRESGRERFLARLATRIGRYVRTITSLGIPIVYRSPSSGQTRLLLGPYVAPLDAAATSTHDVDAAFRGLAGEHGVPYETARDWVIANNGFVDLRAHALVSAAKEPGPRMGEAVRGLASAEELAAWIDALPAGSYFTTCGLVALEYRLRRLYGKVRRRQIRLGTRETWKHLFPQDGQGRYLLSPGLIETARMYSEGLGKVTGTEALWPGWGY
ncbi:MAG TPA: hypothetical protein VGG06_07415 [Thermoanaerobaculia bacterium]|jgi:hypothetical protein